MRILIPVILPLACFAALYLNFKLRFGWRESFLLAAITWGILTAFFTEALSLFRAIEFWTLVIAWTLATLAAFFLWIKNARLASSFNLSISLQTLSFLDYFLLAAIAVIGIVLGIICFYAAPNNWDSMTYHLGRAVHWIQNKNVAFYPTHILRQLHMSPWSEYALMHILILSQTSDLFVNFMQWFAMVSSLIGVSLIAEQLGAATRGQTFSAAIAASIPMGILQATSTQNDYACAFWLVCFVYFGLRFKSSGMQMKDILPVGLSLGLAILTKATAYLFAFPFLVWFALSVWQSQRVKALRPLMIIAALVIMLNAAMYWRNYSLYGSPLGPDREMPSRAKYSNEIFTPASVASNLIRNFAIHLGTPDYRINIWLDRLVYSIHEKMGIDTNDSRTTWMGTEFHVFYLSYYEGKAGNLLHTLLILIVIPLFLFHKFDKTEANKYLIALLAGYFIFSAYLKWQSWNSRLELPLFVLWSPLMGYTLSKARLRPVMDFIVIGLMICSIPYVTGNESRPLLGKQSIFLRDREWQYFIRNKDLYDDFIEARSFLERRGCSQIGLMLDADSWEYPFWKLLNNSSLAPVRMEHVNVKNLSNTLDDPFPPNSFTPCAIVEMGSDPSNAVTYNGVTFSIMQNEGVVNVYIK